MNNVHFHLVSNNLPIAGLLLKQRDVKLSALGDFVFNFIPSIVAFYTCEGAEDVVEKIDGVSETLIDTHEENSVFYFNHIKSWLFSFNCS